MKIFLKIKVSELKLTFSSEQLANDTVSVLYPKEANA
jgi:hypothetical protein